MAMVEISRFDVCLINLDPRVGLEIKKTRPCVIISPNEMNHYIKTVIVAPMTTKSKSYPSRAEVNFDGKSGQIVLDQIRTIDKARIVKKLGTLQSQTAHKLSEVLVEIFTY